ncbi:V-type ATP synthase subunit E [Candidatus Peregrinibacteria bacterium]|nr:V-type ATP synthase subunit E [Candidatus Peregrinibacteria bacterium]
MALSDILQKINDEAGKKAAFMKQVADDEIAKIKAEAKVKAEEKKREIAEKVQAKSESVREKAAVLAKMEGRNKLLAEKRQVIDDVYTEAGKTLSGLKGSELSRLLVSMLKSASQFMPKGHLTVATGHRKDLEEAIKKAGVDYSVKNESSDIDGGFVVSDGKQEINLSFNYLIKSQIRPNTELFIAKILFD